QIPSERPLTGLRGSGKLCGLDCERFPEGLGRTRTRSTECRLDGSSPSLLGLSTLTSWQHDRDGVVLFGGARNLTCVVCRRRSERRTMMGGLREGGIDDGDVAYQEPASNRGVVRGRGSHPWPCLHVCETRTKSWVLFG